MSSAAIQASGFTKQQLQDIFSDYIEKKDGILEQYKNEFLSKFIVSAKDIRLHSYSGRVKDPYHLIEKIIRKRNNKNSKYADMRVDDYYKYITDLIGCRILLVYKRDWKNVHEYLMKVFSNDPAMYVDEFNYVEGYLKAGNSNFKPYIAEKPVVYIRAGDEESLYSGVENIEINKRGYYRSAHYIVRYKEYYVEIQVRSLFEEAWGEVDHDILYPLHKDDEELVAFSSLLNRVSGVGDEMSSFFREHTKKNIPVGENKLLDTPNLLGLSLIAKERLVGPSKEISAEDDNTDTTPSNELDRLINES